MPDTYGRAMVLVGAGLNGIVALRAMIALAQATDAFTGSFRDAQAVMRDHPPSVLCVTAERLSEQEWKTVARWASEGVSRVLVLVDHAPEKSYATLTVIRAATTELGPHARAVIAEPDELTALRAFTKEMCRN